MINTGVKQSDEPDVYIIIDAYEGLARRSLKEVKDSIDVIAKQGRAVNMHLIVGMEERNNMTTSMKINMTCQIDLMPDANGIEYKYNGKKMKDILKLWFIK